MKTTLSQNEINARSSLFAHNWKDTTREEADAQAFLIDFFNVLGINRKQVAIFEHQVNCLDGGKGYIDLLWKGKILIEMKSRGKDLTKAFEQACRYAETLSHYEAPSVILICDFENWHFYDMENGAKCTKFILSQLPEYIHLFYYLAGYKNKIQHPESPVNVQAAELLGKLYDRLNEARYPERDSEILLVRILFCLFADDTGIFDRDTFHNYIETRTAQDGSDLGIKLAELFQVLNTPVANRMSTLDCFLNKFPYINGGVFARPLFLAAFDSKMRNQLLQCCTLDWSKISPAIFGSMFQSVMNANLRRRLGAHYTSEENILKVIEPLFLDSLYEEFEKLKTLKIGKEKKLKEFHEKIASLAFLDPACGCGNFLIIAYRELRLLELKLIKEIKTDNQLLLDATELCKVCVSQFYGIEIEEFPTQIARVAMWLMDHLMNIEISNYFGKTYSRIPLSDTSSNIVCANALKIDWTSIIDNKKVSYVLGNPPFVGGKLMSPEQRADMAWVFGNVRLLNSIDYVAAWFKKTAEYIKNTNIEAALVSTNSISQGQQVGILWKELFENFHMQINFAYRTFKWDNEARQKASVFCVIIGFAQFARSKKYIYQCSTGKDKSIKVLEVKNINGYLQDNSSISVEKRSSPLCSVPMMSYGNMPNPSEPFVFSKKQLNDFLAKSPETRKFFRTYVSAKDYLSGKKRYCLWLHNVEPSELKRYPAIRNQLEKVRNARMNSSASATRAKASIPALFFFISHNDTPYIIIPRVSSSNYTYVPMGIADAHEIASDACAVIQNATLYHLGVLMSSMHNLWIKAVAGRLKGDIRYSPSVVYNTFPWPDVTEDGQKKISLLAQGVLDARAAHPNCSLSSLYDPLSMPTNLIKAHRKLDLAVEQAYGCKFSNDEARLRFLFDLYSSLTASADR